MYTLLKRTVSVLIIAALVLSPVRVYADVEMPTGGTINPGNGTGTIGSVVQDTVNGTASQVIYQGSDRMIVDWNTFSVGTGGTVVFSQPTPTSIALNRVNGGSPSNIMGTIDASGRIFLVNPNGILFGPDSVVNSAGLLASTLAYADTDAAFMGGTNTFVFDKSLGNVGSPGSIINQGELNVYLSPGGFVALLAPHVENSGVITVASSLNTIMLASGSAVTLALDPQNLISVKVGDPGSASDGVINSGTLNAPNGTILINAQVVGTALKNAVNNTGVIEANDIVITSNGNIELLAGPSPTEPSRIKAHEQLNGNATIKIESTEGNVDIIGTEISAAIETEGPDYGDARIDILAGDDDSTININGSEVETSVRGGSSVINIAAGSYSEMEGDGSFSENLSGNGTINISNDSTINALTSEYSEATSYTSIGIKAEVINIEDSFVVARNGGMGSSQVNILAGNYDFDDGNEYGYGYKDFEGGILNLINSGVLASSGKEGEEGVATHVRMYAHDIYMDGSAVVAQQEESGSAIVDIYAGNLYEDEIDEESIFSNAGDLTIMNPVTFPDDKKYLIVNSIPSVGALVGKDGEAEVDIEGGDILVDHATILGEVFGNTTGDGVLVGIYAGDVYQQGEDKSLSEYTDDESYSLTFGGKDSIGPGIINLVSSDVSGRVDGNGNAQVEFYASGDSGMMENKSTQKPFPTGGITLDDTSVSAEAVGEGYEVAKVVMQAGNYSVNKNNSQSNERLDGGSINIQNNSSVLAKTASLVDTSSVELKAMDITIDNSMVEALADNEESGMSNGSAYVLLRAGEWVDEFYADEPDGYSALMAGSLKIQNGQGVYAEVTGSGNAIMELEAVDILIDNANAQAAVDNSSDLEIGSGIRMIGGLINWYRSTELHSNEDTFTNREGTINIQNNSAVMARVGQGTAYDNFFVNALNVKDSSVKSLVTSKGEGEGNAYIAFYPDNDVDSYFYPRHVTIDHSIVTADVSGADSEAYIQFGYEPGQYYDDLGLDIINGSEVTASIHYADGESWIQGDFGTDVNIENSKVTALTEGSGEAHLDFNLVGEGNNFNVTNSTLTSQVTGEGYADIVVYNSENSGFFSGDGEFSDMLGGMLGSLLNDKDSSGPILGSINITSSTLQAQANSTSGFSLSDMFNNNEDMGAAVIGMMSYEPITVANSTLSATETNHPAVVGLLSESNVTVDAASQVMATTSGSDSLAVVGLLATGSDENHVAINIPGSVSANAGDGLAAVGIFGYGDVNATGSVSATGNADGISAISSFLTEQQLFLPIALGLSNIGSATLLGSLWGNITLGQISGDLIGVLALGEDGPASIYGTSNGMIAGKYLGLLARNDIGTSTAPLNTNVDAVAGLSWWQGDIYIKEANDIALGLFVPVSVGGVNWTEVKTIVPLDEDESAFNFGVGISLAAKDGIVHVESDGDIVVNSVIAPNGGVYLKTDNGSIFAGNGWDPTVYCGDGCGEAVDSFAYLMSSHGIRLSESFYYSLESVVNRIAMYNPFVGEESEANYFLPVTIQEPGEGGNFFNDGPNVIAGGYSYFSSPNGTIGVGDSTNKDLNISGQILGVVRPGTTAVTGLNPSVDLDLTQGVPPGLVYYDDNNSYSGSPLDGSSVENDGPDQVWPVAPIVSPVLDNVNPLRVHIDVLPDSKSAIPDGFTPLLSGLTLQIGKLTPPPPPPPPAPTPQPQPVVLDTGVSQLVNPLFKDLRAYYEILHEFRMVSVEPMNPTTFFAYHPLNEADSEAFNGVNLDQDAYEYIDGNLNYKGAVSPYLEEEKQ